MFQKVNNKCADQTVRMRRLVCAFVVRILQSQALSRRSLRVEAHFCVKIFLVMIHVAEPVHERLVPCDFGVGGGIFF